jgi:hypothetical protein
MRALPLLLALVAMALPALAALPASAPAAEGGVGLSECTGFGPLQTDCVADERYLDGSDYLGFSIYPGCGTSCLVADLQVVAQSLDDPGVHTSWTCSLVFLPGYQFVDIPAGCRAPHPISQVGMARIDCHARAFGTIDPAVPGSGQPLPVGEWGCFTSLR